MWRRLVVVCLVPVVLLASGCTADGLGWIPSNDRVSKATFGFHFDGTTSTLSGSYHDPQGRVGASTVDVDFKGAGPLHPCGPTASTPCPQNIPPTVKGGCIGGNPDYQSQNPNLPGSGMVSLTVCDMDGNGQGNAGDLIELKVMTGPYGPYENAGSPQGNITVMQ